MRVLGKLSPARYMAYSIWSGSLTAVECMPYPPLQDNSSTDAAVSLFNSTERLTQSFAQNLSPGDSANFTSDNLGKTVQQYVLCLQSACKLHSVLWYRLCSITL